MKKILALILALVMLVGMLPQMALSAAAEETEATGEAKASWDTDGDGTLEILAIGNSFSVDALQYAYQIAQALGIEKVVIGNLYIGGCSLATHAANAAGDLAKYTYYYNDSGSWTSTSKYKMSTALESRSWDFVSLQQASNYSGVESTYNDDLTDLVAYVQAHSDAKLVWHMTWAYQQNSTHSAFPTYNKDQMTMYNAIVSAVQNKIVNNGNFDFIVPNGTAVQNSRTSLLGDTTTRDGYHMSYVYGRYLTGLLFIKTVTGLSVDNITYAPSGLKAEEKIIAIESVNNASVKPFEATQSAYVEEEPEIPSEGYIQLKTELYQGAYWHPMKAGQYNQTISDASNSYQFFTTIRFTRETLPVGSVIILKNGWQYRPDGWITDTLQTGTRETATAESYVEVTEDWWGDYTIRSFNVSRVGGGSVMNLTEDEMRGIFQIYVPEESHSHKYENSVCILCDAAFIAPKLTVGENGKVAVENDFNRIIVFYLGADDSFAGKTNPSWSKLVAEGKKYVAMNGTAGYKTYQVDAELPALTLSGNYAISVKYTDAEGVEKTIWFTPFVEGEAYHAPVITVDENGQIGVDVHEADTFLRVCLFYIADYEPQKNPGLYSGWIELIKKGKEHKTINGSEGYKIHKDLNNLPQLDDPSNYAILVKYNGADGTLRTAYLIP